MRLLWRLSVDAARVFKMDKKVTYLDSNILIAAFQGRDEVSKEAVEILSDLNREFVISEYLKLETLPKPTFYKNEEEVEFLEQYFEQAASSIETTSDVVKQAINMASQYDLTPIDSLHISSALTANVDEFLTLEKNTKPMFNVRELKVISIRK